MFAVVRQHYDLSGNGTKFLVSKERSKTIGKIFASKALFGIDVDVDFDINGGDNIEFSNYTYTLGQKYEKLPSADYDDHRFICWNTLSSGEGNDVISSSIVTYEDRKLYAKYIQLIALTYDCDGGKFDDETQTKTIKYAPNYALSCYEFPSNPTKTGLNFCGWYTELSGSGTKITSSSICPSNPTTYYADFREQAYTVNLNSQWQNPTKWTNTDERFVVYESNSNYNVSNGVATMYINLTGYTEFTIYINSYAESNYDYTRAYNVDSSTQLTSTKGYQYNPSSYTIDSGTGWRKVTYTLDGGIHQITIDYRKDGSDNSNWDRGYVAIPV